MHGTYDGRAGTRGSHSNSSAFSPNANANEDWTKISDLAERRRIQNRIAQRNYRKKLKRRLEDLERRAGTSDSSEQLQQEPVVSNASAFKASPSKTRTKNRAPKPEVISSISNDYYNTPEDRSMFAQRCTRQLPASPPPHYQYMTLDLNRQPYTGPNPYYESIYPSHPPHFADSAPLFDSVQPLQPNNDIMSSFGASYPGIDPYPHHQHHQQQAQQQQQQQHPVHLTPQEEILPVPSLGYSYADQRVASASPGATIFALPPTPESELEYSESGPCSPLVLAFDYDLRT